MRTDARRQRGDLGTGGRRFGHVADDMRVRSADVTADFRRTADTRAHEVAGFATARRMLMRMVR